MHVPVVQFRHYLRRWRPESSLVIGARSGGPLVWRAPTTEEYGDLLTAKADGPTLSLFTVSPYSVAKLATAIDTGVTQPLLEDFVEYLHRIQLAPRAVWTAQLLAIAPEQSGVLADTARDRRMSTDVRQRAVVANLGPAIVRLCWATSLEGDVARIDLVPNEGALYQPASTEIAVTTRDGIVVLVDAVTT